MPNFRFVLHECGGKVVRDDEWRKFPDLAAAQLASREEARTIMAEEIRHGRLCLSCWIVILDESERHAFTLHFGDAIDVVNQRACSS